MVLWLAILLFLMKFAAYRLSIGFIFGNPFFAALILYHLSYCIFIVESQKKIIVNYLGT